MTNLAIVIAILTTGFLLAGGSLWGVRESHIDPLEETSDIDVHEEKNQAKIFGAFILITLIVFFSTDDFIFESLSLLALAFVVFMFCMHASTAFASKLSSINNRNFQITVALVYPLVLSYYFIKNTTFLSIEMFLGNITTTGIVFILIILCISFAVGKQSIDIKFPFRGYIISAAILFLISFIQYGAATRDEDPYIELFTYLDPKRAKEYVEAGLIFTQYWLYVSASYLGLLCGFMKRWKKS